MSLAGKVRRRACGQHTSEPFNARMRGKSCPKALVSPEPEHVCPKVGAKPHKSCFSSPGGKVEAWKRRSEPPVLEPGESSDLCVDQYIYFVDSALRRSMESGFPL